MKRGDIISRDSIKEVGTEITGSGLAKDIEMLLIKEYEDNGLPIPKHDFIPIETLTPGITVEHPNLTGHIVAVLKEALFIHEEAQVNWVIDGGVAIQYKDGNCRIFELVDEPDWKVIVESVPSYQSSVENMTDDDLRKAIDDLRAQRTFITSKPKRISIKRETVDRSDPLAVALASMPQDKKAELMRKLGMVD